jgi:phosphonate transport system substrate-binding protein
VSIPPLKLAITDVAGLEELEANYEEFRAEVAKALGAEVTFFPVENYTAATVSLKQGEIDLALTGPSEYVVINSRTNATPVIAITRPDYHSVIAVAADSGITSLVDLRGKTIAMSDIGSTSGHLGPTKLLIDAGLDPKTDLAIQMLGDEGSAEALKNGDVDAWGGSGTDYEDMLQDDATSYPILVEGPPLPSDVLVVSSSLDPAVVELVRDRLVAAEAALVAAIAIHERKYDGSSLVPANDEDYDLIREVYDAIGQGDNLS